MDFTIDLYKRLLSSLMGNKYHFQTFEQFLQFPEQHSIILRHDVDVLPKNALAFARIQYGAGIRGVYYFRAVRKSWNEDIIKEIAGMGHEIGYHYECLTTCLGNKEEGIKDFTKNLSAMRRLAPVKTICMHGSPMSRYDSKDLWEKYNYRDFGIIGEPYFDVDFSRVFYLTDTGRTWDGEKVSVRDKVNSGFGLRFQTTDDIIRAFEQGIMPGQIMFTFHPQRWSDNKYLWTKELITQNAKNIIKRYFFVR